MAHAELQLRLASRPDLTVHRSDGATQLQMGTTSVQVGPPPSGGRALLERLRHGVPTPTDPGLRYWLGRLDDAAALARELRTDETVHLRVEPLGRAPTSWGADLPPGPLALSRFAHAHRHEGALCITTPLAPFRLVVRDRQLLPDLLDPPVERPVASPLIEAALRIAYGHRFLVECHQHSEDVAPLASWDPDALRTHRHARRGYEDAAVGKHADTPPRPRSAAPDGELHPLSEPAPSRTGRALAQCLAARRSERRYASTPPDITTIAALLFDTVREDVTASRARPHPSAGRCYPLETYLVAGTCEGLSSGVYHYRADTHRLCRRPDSATHVPALLRGAQASMGSDAPPPVALLLTARFARTFAHYGRLAYPLIQQEAGLVAHNISLLAAQLGLGTCMLGTGDSARFARATSIDPLHEDVVAGLALGVRATT